MIDQLVRQRAVRLQERRERNLAVRVANALGGGRSVDGGGGANTSSTG